MRRGLEWYKRNPILFLGGIQGLTDREVAVYAVIIELIYIHGGSVNNDPKWIAGWFSNMGAASVRNTIADLVMLGKIQIEGDQITNIKATEVTGEQGYFAVPDEPEKPKKRKAAKPKIQQKPNENAEKTPHFSPVSPEFSAPTSSENNDLTSTDKIREEQKEKEDTDVSSKSGDQQTALALSGDATPDPVQEAVDAFNAEAERSAWSKCQKVTTARRSKIKARLKDAGGIDGWMAALALAAESPFLCGQTREAFTMGIDFMLQESSFTKLMEGRYAARASKSQGATASEIQTSIGRAGDEIAGRLRKR